MIGKPYGCIIALVEEWNKFHDASTNCVVIQKQTVSGIASMRVRNGKWEIELGE